MNPAQWYSEQASGYHDIEGGCHKIAKNCYTINGYCTNHNIHRTGATHKFQAGLDCKVVQ